MENKNQFALKVIDKEEIKKKNLGKRIKNEIEIHIHLNRAQLLSLDPKDKKEGKNQPIIQLYHCFEDQHNIYLLMELIPGQELYQMIKSLKTKKTLMPEEQVCQIFGQIAFGVHCMQQ